MSEFTLKTSTQSPDLPTAMQVVYQWDYTGEVEELRAIYVKATEAQWSGAKDAQTTGRVFGVAIDTEGSMYVGIRRADYDTPHTGTLVYAEDQPKIPAACITIENATMMRRMSDRSSFGSMPWE